ncbi:MAG TPA: hypothetical protein VMU25_04075 [Candidatus Paceibacterota bacterium]|nr:hypothetical protein [Candidatus Paceibacterota bacterium]
MQYLHQSVYGHAGGFHTAKPVMAMDHGHIYDIKNGRPDLAKPLYRVENGKAFATEFHPNGASPHAMFEIKGDKVHTTQFHPAHNPSSHTFEIKPGMYT